jgi:hypothetical protein
LLHGEIKDRFIRVGIAAYPNTDQVAVLLIGIVQMNQLAMVEYAQKRTVIVATTTKVNAFEKIY